MAFDEPTQLEPLDAQEAEIWVTQAKQGDTRAFGYVYEYFMPMVYKFVYFRINSREDSEDLTEKIFFKAWQSIHKFDTNKASFKTWLFTITRHTIIDFYRTHKVTYELNEAIEVASDEVPHEEIDKQMAFNKIIPVLKSLPAEQSEILALRFLSQLSIKEAAAVMKKTEGAIRVLQHRALKQIRLDLQTIWII